MVNKPELEIDEGQMVSSMKEGNFEGLGKWYRDNRMYFYCIALRLTESHEDAEDIVNDLFVRIMDEIGSFRGEGVLRAWARSTLINIYRMKARKFRRSGGHHFLADEGLLERLGSTDAVTPEDIAISTQRGEVLSRVVAELPDGPSMNTFREWVSDGMPKYSAGSYRGLIATTAKSRVFRGYQRTRGQLNQIGINGLNDL